MTRKEVFDACVESCYEAAPGRDEVICVCRHLLPMQAIDAIIDCAVEEAVAIMKVKESEGK